MHLHELYSADPEIYQSIVREAERQHAGLELIASENFTSIPVLQASGSVMTNKYAEGYPARRYYGGCEFVDEAERLLPGAGFVTVRRMVDKKEANQRHAKTIALLAAKPA